MKDLIFSATSQLSATQREQQKEIERTNITCKDLKLTIASVRALVDQCATKSLFNRLEIFTETLATKSAFLELKNEVAGKSSMNHFNCLQFEIEQIRKDFSLANKNAASKSEEI